MQPASFSSRGHATMDSIQQLTADHPQSVALLEAVVSLHAACILNDETMATFIPPLSRHRMRERWHAFLGEVSAGKRVTLVATSATGHRTETPGDLQAPFGDGAWPLISPTEELTGVISLSMPDSETGPFRGLVQNLFISPYHRRKGLASRLLQRLEKQASEHSRWNLMLDTMQGSAAEALYIKLEWRMLGVVNDYGIDPNTGGLLNEVFFVKDLRSLRG